MKQIETKLAKLEKEIMNLKLMIINDTPKMKVSLKGILKNLKVDEEDIIEAKKSLFKVGV